MTDNLTAHLPAHISGPEAYRKAVSLVGEAAAIRQHLDDGYDGRDTPGGVAAARATADQLVSEAQVYATLANTAVVYDRATARLNGSLGWHEATAQYTDET